MSKDFIEPQEETYTQWHNPLDVEQVVDIRMGDNPQATRYRFPPGATKAIPSRFDNVVHRVHNGVIIGGQAPQLVRVGADEQLDAALDTEIAKKRLAEGQLAQAALAKKVAEDAAAVAALNVTEADRKLKSRSLPPDLKNG